MKHWNLIDKITWAVWALIFAGAVIAGWEYFYPVTIIKLHSLKVLHTPVMAGDYVAYELCYTKYHPGSAKVILTLTNSTSQTIRVSEGDVDVGSNCRTNYVRIPRATDEDTDYVLGWEAIYHPTNLAEKSYRIKSQTFEIIENPDGLKGEKGEPGERGPRGEKGKPGKDKVQIQPFVIHGGQ